MRISLIAAVAANGVIGRDGALPWHLPADLARFKTLTWGHHLILGRRTYESFGRPLPGRRIVVLTRRRDRRGPEGIVTAGGLGEALEIARRAGDDEAFVGGGAGVYAEALPLADRLYWTAVDAEVEGDTRFPPFAPEEWRLVAEERHVADAENPHPYRFLLYERSAPAAEGS